MARGAKRTRGKKDSTTRISKTVADFIQAHLVRPKEKKRSTVAEVIDLTSDGEEDVKMDDGRTASHSFVSDGLLTDEAAKIKKKVELENPPSWSDEVTDLEPNGEAPGDGLDVVGGATPTQHELGQELVGELVDLVIPKYDHLVLPGDGKSGLLLSDFPIAPMRRMAQSIGWGAASGRLAGKSRSGSSPGSGMNFVQNTKW
ncbi:unnamed protein product, partial [Mesorhabditis belari]|uniref:Uncharacterized protein n=1 Tax=Mesorhabditis belari TaxID=2138241 RepID=A0AAF3EW62_9BILA